MNVQKSMEDICLKHDNGGDFSFRGRLFSECSERSRHAYRLAVRGDNCIIHNGMAEMSLQFDMLMLAVRGLCGLEAGATPTLSMVEEMLKAANA